MLYENLTDRIIHAAMEVHKTLGFGFLEAVYGNALYKELKRCGIKCECQKTIDVYYKGEKVGQYIADMLIEDTIIVDTWYTDKLKSKDRIKLLETGEIYEIMNTPEDINRRHKWMKFKAVRIHG